MNQALLIPREIDIYVTRRTDVRFRVTLYEANAVADLTGDTVTFIAKDAPGGVTKVEGTVTLEDQTGALKGKALVVLPRAQLVDAGTPNDAPVSEIKWPFQVRRSHAGLLTVPISGYLILKNTI